MMSRVQLWRLRIEIFCIRLQIRYYRLHVVMLRAWYRLLTGERF